MLATLSIGGCSCRSRRSTPSACGGIVADVGVSSIDAPVLLLVSWPSGPTKMSGCVRDARVTAAGADRDGPGKRKPFPLTSTARDVALPFAPTIAFPWSASTIMVNTCLGNVPGGAGRRRCVVVMAEVTTNECRPVSGGGPPVFGGVVSDRRVGRRVERRVVGRRSTVCRPSRPWGGIERRGVDDDGLSVSLRHRSARRPGRSRSPGRRRRRRQFGAFPANTPTRARGGRDRRRCGRACVPGRCNPRASAETSESSAGCLTRGIATSGMRGRRHFTGAGAAAGGGCGVARASRGRRAAPRRWVGLERLAGPGRRPTLRAAEPAWPRPPCSPLRPL